MIGTLLCIVLGHRDAIPVVETPDGYLVATHDGERPATALLCGRCLTTRTLSL